MRNLIVLLLLISLTACSAAPVTPTADRDGTTTPSATFITPEQTIDPAGTPTSEAKTTPASGSPTPTSIAPTPTLTVTAHTTTATPKTTIQTAQWSTLEFTLLGPDSTGLDTSNNPFATVVDVTFTAPDGREFIVPAFYDGDGQGGMDGNLWKVRFTPDVPGTWSYISQSDQAQLNNQQGAFMVTAVEDCPTYQPGDLPDLACVGRLQYVGEPYLKFAAGPYWLKGGADEPEDFLAPEETAGFATKQAAIDFLAEHGVNSIYILLHNIGGDSRNVWPWFGQTEDEARGNSTYFDVARLAEWESIFNYLQENGIVLHLVLEDDSAWNDFDRSAYYRQMVARFSHYNGLIWNIAEEYNELYSPEEIKSFAAMVRTLDPYEHPITVHHAGGLDRWEPFVGMEPFDITSFQTQKEPRNEAAVNWREKVAEAGRVIPISFDEIGQFNDTERDLARHVLWATYLGGANYEIFTTLSSEGYQAYREFFADITLARRFLEELSFWEMQPANTLVTEGEAYLLAESESAYVAYLPRGGDVTIDLTDVATAVAVEWLNPRTGERQSAAEIKGGVLTTFTPPFTGDAVLRLLRVAPN